MRQPLCRHDVMRVRVALAILTLAVVAWVPTGAGADYVSEHPDGDRFPLVQPSAVADIFVAEDDWKVARIAAQDLALDVERVTGRRPKVVHRTEDLSGCAVFVGTLGKSRVIDGLVADGRLDVADIQGRWESFVVASVADPLPGVRRGLVIAGSDRRGTAYGVYELSRRIGVSPWYWWADVTPRRRAALYVAPDRLRVGPPAVKYRGIFINDEMWGIRPWACNTFAPDEGDGLGPKTYAKIFELLLRLRANYLWPAMHVGTIPFNCYPRNRAVADDYAIVMGSSHIEPMLRNNIAGGEWDREGGKEWNYQTNAAAIREYWARRLEANGKFENVYTLGMRGKDDEPMQGGATLAEKIALMERIFADQRDLIARYVHSDPAKAPQVFIPYTEVLGIYDAGLRVPNDAIICWPDDNFGYIRRLPTAAERARPGGSGVYYHIQWLNGATTAYTWLNTTPPALIWEEMHKAWEYGASELWVLNVGDIKPGEIGVEFFLDMACNPERWRCDTVGRFLEEWAARDIDARLAPEIAAIMDEHFRLGFARRPEHLIQYRAGKLSYSWFSHDQYNDEAGQRLDGYADLGRRARAVYDRLPQDRKDAFFQLVLYPVACAGLMNRQAICADKSVRCAADGRAVAAEYARQARAARTGIVELTERYNRGLVAAGDKWNQMMSAAPGPWGNQRYQFEMPPLGDFAGRGAAALGIATEGGGPDTVADLSVYTQGRRFIDLFNKGTDRIRWRAMTSEPWLKLDHAEGYFTTEQRLWVSIDWDRAPKGRDLKAAIDIESDSGNRRIAVPVFNPAEPSRDAANGFVESHGYVSMEAEHFARRCDRDGAGWRTLAGLGRSGDGISVLPATAAGSTDPADIAGRNPAVEYDMYLFTAGDHPLHIDCLPTQPVAPGRGVRLAIGLDGARPQVLGDRPRPPGDVLANLRRYTATVTIDKPGHHTLTVWMVDPGVVIDKIVLCTATPRDSYLGPPESYRR